MYGITGQLGSIRETSASVYAVVLIHLVERLYSIIILNVSLEMLLSIMTEIVSYSEQRAREMD